MTNKKSDLISRYFRYQVDDIQNDIGAIENNTLLFEEKNFDKRTEAIDFIGFHIIDRIEGLLPQIDQPDQLILLKNRAEKIKTELEAIDVNLFQKLQNDIGRGVYTSHALKNLVQEYVEFNLANNEHQQEAGYDNLDVFINGLFPYHTMPDLLKDLEPEMVFYQKTPARIIFEMVEKVNFTKNDVFFDLGSGLGHVTMLVNLLAGIKTIGVEFEPAFCQYAIDCVLNLNLSNIEFINIDARKADYSMGTVFFMYTPFNGKIMEDVLETLRKESLSKKIKIITYGPCTAEVATQNWLECKETQRDNIYKLTVFNSLEV